MRALLLPNGNLLIPTVAEGAGQGSRWSEIDPGHPEYGKWRVGAEEGEDPRRENETPPWLRAGSVRRDCEPHRGPLLRALALASLLCGILFGIMPPMLVCTGIGFWTPYFPPAIQRGVVCVAAFATCAHFIGVFLAVMVWRMTREDLRKMTEGLMDRAGKEATHRAREMVLSGLLCSLVGWITVGVAVCLWLRSPFR